MQEHQSTSLFMTLVFLMGLAGCVADSTKSPSDTVTTSAVGQAEKGTDQPPTGEVQERAVPGRMAPGPLLSPALSAAPKGAVPPLQPPPVPLGLPGEFVIFTTKGNPLSAVNGGGNVNDGINTAASGVSTYSKFKLWTAGPQAPQYKFIETANGYTVMAPNGGGRADSTAIVADLKGLPYGQYIPWAMFSFGRTFPYTTTIQTSNGNFVTAVGGGGQLTNALHTDAKTAQSWEFFNVFKCGDLGTGFTYALILQHGISSTFSAPDGGGRTQEAIRMSIPDDHLARFTLIRQADGTYALRTPNGINYVTALGGGGQPPSDENFHTDATQVQAWEKFRIVDNGQCRYTIQTVSGGFVGFPSLTAASLATNISKVDGPLGTGGLGPVASWLLYMFDLYPGMNYTP